MAALHRAAVVAGAGARTSVGLNAPSTAAAVRAGIGMMAQHPFMLDRKAAPMVVCADAMLPVDVTGVERLLALALPPAREALRPLLQRTRSKPRLALFLALPEARPGGDDRLEQTFPARFASALSNEIDVTHIACERLGHAGGLWCIEQALSLLANGASDACLVGGVDSYLEAETLEWLDSLEQLHSDTTIWGLCPGEGAGFCLLMSPERAASLDVPAPVAVLGASSAFERNRIKTDTVCVGNGLSEAFRKTLALLPDEDRVTNTICDMNGEPYRANEYGFAVLRTASSFADDSDFVTPADCWGDVGAASGPLFTVLASFAACKGYSPGAFTLLWASSEGGLRAAALLEDLAPGRRG